MQNLFRVYNKDTRMTSITSLCLGVLVFQLWKYFTHCYGVSIVDFEQGMTIGKKNITMLATITVRALPPNESIKTKQQEISSKSKLKVKLKMV